MRRCYLCVCRSLAVASLLLSAGLIAQGQTSLRVARLLGASSPAHEICMSGGALGTTDASDAQVFLRLVGSSRDLPEDVCGTLGREEWRTTASIPLRSADQPVAHRPDTDLVEVELVSMGKAGLSIAAAREQVLQILRDANACSVWFAQNEPDPAEKFATLHFGVDGAGEVLAHIADPTSGLYLEPYVARSQQNVGRGSVITFNAHGAFFQLHAPTDIMVVAGSTFRTRFISLTVGNYDGGSLRAQVTTLLHEYAHIVDLLPVDYGHAGSARLSTQNTETVLNHCRAQIEASRNRTIVLPASLATLENRDN